MNGSTVQSYPDLPQVLGLLEILEWYIVAVNRGLAKFVY